MRPLSYSQISLYQTCPLCYKLQYIDRLETKYKGYFSFGTTMHACAEYFFKVKVPPPPPLEELLQFYDKNWLSAGYESAEEEANYKVYGREMLAKFWEIHQPGFRMPIAVEWMFYINVEGIKLRGFIDRVDKLDSGGLAIVDYKTDRELFTNDYLARNLQLTLYQMAVAQSWFLPVERLTLYHFRTNTSCSCPPRDEARIEAARRLVLEVAESIAAGRFPAIEGERCPCDFPEHCPYYQHKFVPEAKEAGISGEVAMAGAVERYVSLQSQIKELQLELDELKRMLADFCRVEGLNRVYGAEHALTYKLVEKTGFSEEEVRALLEPAGLLGRVLSLDSAKLKELISDEAVAKDIRNKLEALKQVVASYPQFWPRRLVEEE
ncbi:MAG: PD-(D/E)XK nuclease family protein [Deltaproteobacteria bacterium]|nr:PD-(D/E)XK nuclease family protein [Deltaproteobacteria bacterium]